MVVHLLFFSQRIVNSQSNQNCAIDFMWVSCDCTAKINDNRFIVHIECEYPYSIHLPSILRVRLFSSSSSFPSFIHNVCMCVCACVRVQIISFWSISKADKQWAAFVVWKLYLWTIKSILLLNLSSVWNLMSKNSWSQSNTNNTLISFVYCCVCVCMRTRARECVCFYFSNPFR